MARELNHSVLVEGEVLSAGTAWSKELGERVPDEFWTGMDKGDTSAEPESKDEAPKQARRSSRSKSE